MHPTLSQPVEQAQTGETLKPKAERSEAWYTAKFGRERVRVYQRQLPGGSFNYMVGNYSQMGANGKPKRRFDCYPLPDQAKEAADALAERLSKRQGKVASMTEAQAVEYVSSCERLKPFNVTVDSATSTVAECLKLVGDLSNLHAAVKFYTARHRKTVALPLAEVIKKFLAQQKADSASERHLNDLKGRLERFAEDCKKDCCDITSADVQAWLNSLSFGKDALSAQSRKNYRSRLQNFFEYAVGESYASDNPVNDQVKIPKVPKHDVQIFTVEELLKLLETAKLEYSDYVPCIAIGAFAGLRSAEIERLDWSEVHLAERFIVVKASDNKTGRRIVPIHENLALWLAPYAKKGGLVWPFGSNAFTNQQQAISRDSGVEWKHNGLRHSYVSYRLTQINGDAGRVSGECGNTAKVILKHYHKLVLPPNDQRWFAVKPEPAINVIPLIAVQA